MALDRNEVARLLAEETVPYELNPEWEYVTNEKVIEAARAWVEPDYEAAWRLAHEWQDEFPVLSAGEIKAVVNAALGLTEKD